MCVPKWNICVCCGGRRGGVCKWATELACCEGWGGGGTRAATPCLPPPPPPRPPRAATPCLPPPPPPPGLVQGRPCGSVAAAGVRVRRVCGCVCRSLGFAGLLGKPFSRSGLQRALATQAGQPWFTVTSS